MRATITTSIDPCIHQEAVDNHIGWSEALTFGIKFLIADKSGIDYPENNLSKKLANAMKRVNELADTITAKEAPTKITPEIEQDFKEAGI